MDKCTDISNHPQFKDELPIAIYVHGYHTNQSSAAIKDLVESFVSYNRQFNMITLDWARFAYLDYIEIASPLAPVVRARTSFWPFGDSEVEILMLCFFNWFSVWRMGWSSCTQLQCQQWTFEPSENIPNLFFVGSAHLQWNRESNICIIWH